MGSFKRSKGPTVTSPDRGHFANRTRDAFTVGPDDLVIVPMVAVALALVKLVRLIIRLLIRLLDFLFPILLQLMRFPLFTLRILGDGITAATRAIVAILPVGGTRRAAWREAVATYWAWLRQRFSYRAFEEWLHHAFESGMAWVFKTCRTLSPRAALLVIFGAVLWLPISFGAATLMHALLLAYATKLPAWMQLLHPFATVIAKSKLLVLPVYPAAWPQAKKHPLVQGMFEAWRVIASLTLARKTAVRYGQLDSAGAVAVDGLKQAASRVGLRELYELFLAGVNETAAAIGWGIHLMLLGLISVLGALPLVGDLVQRYVADYEEAERRPSEAFSSRVSDFFARWSIKFTAEYYETKEREATAHGHAAG